MKKEGRNVIGCERFVDSRQGGGSGGFSLAEMPWPRQRSERPGEISRGKLISRLCPHFPLGPCSRGLPMSRPRSLRPGKEQRERLSRGQASGWPAPPPSSCPWPPMGRPWGASAPQRVAGVPVPRRARTGHLGRSPAAHWPEGWDSPMALSILPSTWLLGMALPHS